MKAGILIDSLQISQKLVETTIEMNKLKNLEEYWDIVVFYVDYGKIIQDPHFAFMDAVNLYRFNGPVIATDLKTASMILDLPKTTRQLLYMWDLEWTNDNHQLNDLLDIYMNPKLELIARSEDHAKIIKNCWKEPVATIEDFDYEKITELLAQ